MSTSQTKSFNAPDETRTPPKAKMEIVNFGDMSIVRMTCEPGWKWSELMEKMQFADVPRCPGQDERGERDAPAGCGLRNRYGGAARRTTGRGRHRHRRVRSRTRHCARARPQQRLSLRRNGRVTLCGCL